jgi:predicted acylesterase/phospholipase RssA
MRFEVAACALIVSVSLAPVFAQNAREDPGPRPKIGLALEGGGALALAHVGVIEWFEQHHIPIDYIAGTSMGGLVGGYGPLSKGCTVATQRAVRLAQPDWRRWLKSVAAFRSRSQRGIVFEY